MVGHVIVDCRGWACYGGLSWLGMLWWVVVVGHVMVGCRGWASYAIS